MDIFTTYADRLAEQLDNIDLYELKQLDLNGKNIFYFRPYLTRYQKATGKRFKTKKYHDEYYIKRIL